MEVHAHTHTARKKWTHYFWEFLMLFLAIFCGFLAENQREHYIEHQREKKYARQLLADLRADSMYFTRMIPGMQERIDKHNQFSTMMTSGKAISNADIIKAIYQINNVYVMSSVTATYIQMKTSGTLRYIRNESITSELQKYYDAMLERIKLVELNDHQFYNNYFQTYFVNHFMSTDYDAVADTLLNKNPVFRNRTKDTETQLVNIMNLYKQIISTYLENNIKPFEKKSHALIKVLKQEYHLQ